jgi:hypothetical protein
MTSMTPAGYVGEGSPDRADALVWALTELNTGRRYNINALVADDDEIEADDRVLKQLILQGRR